MMSISQNASDCYCGDAYGHYGNAPEHECNMLCGDDDTRMCGGLLRNSLYRSQFSGQ